MSCLSKSLLRCPVRGLAIVSPSLITQPPHPPPPPKVDPSALIPPLLDSHVLRAVSRGPTTSLQEIVKQYVASSGTVLDVSLPYESRPSEMRQARLQDENESRRNVVTVAHCVQGNLDHKVTLSSGFALNVGVPGGEDETVILTCAHTLEQIRQSPLLLAKAQMGRREDGKDETGTFVLTGSGRSLKVHPVSRVVSALPRSDLLLLSCKMPPGAVHALPVSPYPVHGGTSILAHFVAHERPLDEGWVPWVGDTWGKWVKGTVLGYRDLAGREAEPGTYDTLSHMLFTPLPTAGSSGGPIIDEEHGSVVGVMLGSRMDNRVEGVRGWGVPSETIFEMFALPGLNK